jgi:serine/threonine protein phosphatase PrpC
MFILCSDGLITEKSTRNNELDFYRIYQKSPDAATFAKMLVKNAFENGSNDNISTLCVSFGEVRVFTKSSKCKKPDFVYICLTGYVTELWQKIVRFIKR